MQVVKVADFGVARVKAQTGVMTAETGTYRWMAPEVVCLNRFLNLMFNSYILKFLLSKKAVWICRFPFFDETAQVKHEIVIALRLPLH